MDKSANTFNRLEGMDLSKLYRFSSMFALFLSNYEVNWVFQTWVPTLTNEKNKHAIWFTKFTLDSIAQLLPLELVKLKVPEELKEFLTLSTSLNNPFINSSIEQEKMYFKSILTQIQKKETKKEEEQPFNKIEKEEDLDTAIRCKIQYFCILEYGSASLSHLFVGLEKHSKFLGTLGSKLISFTFEAWSCHTIVLYRILCKLVHLKLITVEDIVEWLVTALNDEEMKNKWQLQMIAFMLVKDDITGTLTSLLVTQLEKIPEQEQLLTGIALQVI